MSFPGKENVIHFEKLADSQSRIWPDAADLGIEVTNCQGLKTAARENLLALMKIYEYKLTRPEHARYPYDEDFKNCSTTEMFIPYEFDEGHYSGVKLTVNFETITRCGKAREYLSIFIEPGYRTSAEFGNGYKNILGRTV